MDKPIPSTGQLQMGSSAMTNAPSASRPVNILVPQGTHTFSTPATQMSANNYPLPPSITIVVASATAAGALATRVAVFNQDLLSNVTNNGSGAGSITYTYSDGFSGNVVNNLLSNARAGVGAICYGVALRMNVTSSKAGDPSGLAVANSQFITYNALGGQTTLNFNLTSYQQRSDYDTSIEVIPCIQNITRFVQYSFVIPAGDTATITFYFTQL